MTIFVFLMLLVILILLGTPIGFAMALLPAIYIAFTDTIPLTSVPYQMYSALDKFPLVAVPLFLLAGELMNLGSSKAKCNRLKSGNPVPVSILASWTAAISTQEYWSCMSALGENAGGILHRLNGRIIWLCAGSPSRYC